VDAAVTRAADGLLALQCPGGHWQGLVEAAANLEIEGDFVRIDESSRTKRFIIGLGVGATDLRTQVRVFQVTPEGWRPVQQFETVATGSRFPGRDGSLRAGPWVARSRPPR
jgi:hypothetical protein